MEECHIFIWLIKHKALISKLYFSCWKHMIFEKGKIHSNVQLLTQFVSHRHPKYNAFKIAPLIFTPKTILSPFFTI